jgi:glycosyltransferase involved in cell wall biosynthesis
MKISLIIPSYNNLQHLKNAYNSIQKHTPKSEVILLDDGSTDGTWEWIQQQDCVAYRSEERVGHTILYDVGIEMASNDVVGILHADMIIGPNYVENLLKHLKPGTVVCATRIEPPLHPEGKEKIIKDFGMDFDSLDVKSFEEFCLEKTKEQKNQITKGMFAPWVLFKEDFKSIGGHDPLFSPFPYEDSDIFQRWILAGFNMIQSRDSFVYHLTCRGHRWNKEVGKNDDEFKIFEAKARKYYLKKWGSWIKNDEYGHPILSPVYKKKLIITNPNPNINQLHDWFNDGEDIVVEADGNNFTQQDFQIIQQLNDIIKDNGDIGSFELGNLKITINAMNEYQNDLIICK